MLSSNNKQLSMCPSRTLSFRKAVGCWWLYNIILGAGFGDSVAERQVLSLPFTTPFTFWSKYRVSERATGQKSYSNNSVERSRTILILPTVTNVHSLDDYKNELQEGNRGSKSYLFDQMYTVSYFWIEAEPSLCYFTYNRMNRLKW